MHRPQAGYSHDTSGMFNTNSPLISNLPLIILGYGEMVRRGGTLQKLAKSLVTNFINLILRPPFSIS